MDVMKPGDDAFNDLLLETRLKDAECQEMSVAFGQNQSPELLERLEKESKVYIDNSEKILTSMTEEIMKLDLDQFNPLFVTPGKMLPKLVELSSKVKLVRVLMNTELGGDDLLIEKVFLGGVSPQAFDEEYYEKMTSIKGKITNLRDRLDLLEGLTDLARGEAMLTRGATYADITKKMTKEEYKLFHLQNETEDATVERYGRVLKDLGQKKALDAYQRIFALEKAG